MLVTFVTAKRYVEARPGFEPGIFWLPCIQKLRLEECVPVKPNYSVNYTWAGKSEMSVFLGVPVWTKLQSKMAVFVAPPASFH